LRKGGKKTHADLALAVGASGVEVSSPDIIPEDSRRARGSTGPNGGGGGVRVGWVRTASRRKDDGLVEQRAQGGLGVLFQVALKIELVHSVDTEDDDMLVLWLEVRVGWRRLETGIGERILATDGRDDGHGRDHRRKAKDKASAKTGNERHDDGWIEARS
jgi:hypothetical protein